MLLVMPASRRPLRVLHTADVELSVERGVRAEPRPLG
jgi:hypothetical protein